MVTGIALRRSWLCGLGVIMTMGLCLYLALNPLPLRLVGMAVLLCNLSSALAVRLNAHRIAGALLVPFGLTAGGLVYAIWRD